LRSEKEGLEAKRTSERERGEKELRSEREAREMEVLPNPQTLTPIP